ncbi:Rab11 family-interacting protein 4A [Taenia crassiceps]|uniref:Rab11 family-interacting protein 4A n=1 Tax=Taenia crassiceps TaxID=6207 RepID=A0ABR4Q9R1_9CEST
MNLDSGTLRQVFDALDNNRRGYITVEQFTNALEKFYTSLARESPDDEHHAKLARMQSMDVNNIVNALDPEKDGIISFDDFKSAFQNFFNCQSISCSITFYPPIDPEELKGKTMTVNLHGRRVSITPDDFVMQQAEMDQDLRTEDSGFLEPGFSEFTPTRPSTLLLSDFRRPSFRHGTPKHASARTSIPSYNENTGSPFSGSRSDLMVDDGDSNFEQLKNQMRQMEAKMDSMTSQAAAASNVDGLAIRLREENARLCASVVVLEERIKEIEARHQRDLESERSHLDSLMARSKRTYEAEIENLRARCQKLEFDLSEATINLGKAKVELDSARAASNQTREALQDARDKIGSLTDQLNSRSDAESLELQKAIADRDKALNALREVNSVVGNGPQMSIDMDTVERLEEMQHLIQRLKEDNKNLKKQVQDAEEESWFNNLRDGQKLLSDTDSTLDAEMDNLTKEEVVNLLVQEKHANNQLRAYLNTLLEKVVANYPDLLECK